MLKALKWIAHLMRAELKKGNLTVVVLGSRYQQERRVV
jgi:hypothetical protein